MNIILITIAAIVIAVLIKFVLGPDKLNVVCPQCGQEHCEEIGREQTQLDFQNQPSGIGIGARLKHKTQYELRFHCKTCSHTFKKRITETR